MKQKMYIGIIRKGKETDFGVHFPNIGSDAGVFTTSETADDALVAHIDEALSLYFEDMAELPPSNDQELILSAPEVKQDSDVVGYTTSEVSRQSGNLKIITKINLFSPFPA